MPKVDLEKERKLLDREITFFHFKRATRKIKKCIKLAEETKDDFFLSYFLAQRCILRQDYRRAMHYFNCALHIRKNDGCTYNDKALCLAELGRLKEALACFNRGIKRNRDCASLYHNKGWLLHSLGRHKEAAVCFKKALELEAGRVESLYSLADTYCHLNDLQQARQLFHRALRLIKGKSSYAHKQTLKKLNKLER
ncbi:MAG: tetratricopeptide repeat protein [Candidatus Omnitrophota bacterium]|nr:MAG: tetratricopeptide repeat protein [Candidatus Omnitrophota bacterium]